jgi:hypothetical protein
MFRYNNQGGTPVKLEYYDGAAWSPAGSTAGLGLVLDGSAIKVSIPVASTPPAVGSGTAQAVNGSMYWDDTLGQLFIRYINGGTPVWVAAAPPAGGSSLTAATNAEARTGTSTTVYSSPATAVPKDASGMTGAAILPSGTDAQRAAIATLVVGMTRFNTTSNYEEVYTGVAGGWQKLAYTPAPPSPLSDLTLSNGQVLPSAGTYNNITLPAGATVTANAFSNLIAFGTVTLSGTINVAGKGYVGPFVQNTDGSQNGQGPGAGGSGNTAGGNANAYDFLIGSSGACGSADVGAVSSGGGNGGGGVKITSFGSISVSSTFIFSGAGNDGIVSGGSGGGGGGAGGLFFLDCPSITLAAGATINVSGGNGATNGGGGGGGWVVLNGASVTNAATIVKTGGTGGTISGSLRGGGGGSFGGKGGIGSASGSATTAGAAGLLSVNGILS